MPTQQTKPYPEKPTSLSRVLVIGHDPRLRESNAVAQHAFFADLFFKPIPTRGSDLAKYGLAQATYSYIAELTSYRYTASQLVLTNLCNSRLPSAPKGRVVFIPQLNAEKGVAEIKRFIRRSRIEVIFAMSEQVNYWLHALGFCEALTDFEEKAAPRARGMEHSSPYYEPKVPKAFQLISFRRHETEVGVPLYPIVHVRSWPLKGPFKKAYGKAYSACVSDLKHDVA